jgi:D-alanyl-D-alanine carboxypeptidase
MKIKKKYRVLLWVLAVCLFVAAGGFVYYHGEWWYPALHHLTHSKDVALEETNLKTETKFWSLEALIEQENVTLSNNLLLVNASHPLPEGYEAELVEYNGAKMHPLMLDPYIALRDETQEATGVRIYVASDYRTAQEQAEIIASSPDGIAAPLGCSEHEAGLALDVYAPYFGGENFLRSRAGRRVNDLCGEYGYILRYPANKEDVTGIAYEPWHIRYVGQPHAKIMMESGLTLEEYIEALNPGTWYKYGEYLIARLSPYGLNLPARMEVCEISPDNTGYYIVTVRL